MERRGGTRRFLERLPLAVSSLVLDDIHVYYHFSQTVSFYAADETRWGQFRHLSAWTSREAAPCVKAIPPHYNQIVKSSGVHARYHQGEWKIGTLGMGQWEGQSTVPTFRSFIRFSSRVQTDVNRLGVEQTSIDWELDMAHASSWIANQLLLQFPSIHSSVRTCPISATCEI